MDILINICLQLLKLGRNWCSVCVLLDIQIDDIRRDLVIFGGTASALITVIGCRQVFYEPTKILLSIQNQVHPVIVGFSL